MSSPSDDGGTPAAADAAAPQPTAPPPAAGPPKRKRGRPSAAAKAAEAAALAAARAELPGEGDAGDGGNEEPSNEKPFNEEPAPAERPAKKKRNSAEVAVAVAAAARRERVRAILERSLSSAADAGALAGAAERLRGCVPAFPDWARPMAALAVDVWPLSVEIAALGMATDDAAIDAVIAKAPYAALGIPLAVAGGAAISLRRAQLLAGDE